MILVGLTGSIGSGKTTFARYLSDQHTTAAHWESWQLIAEVANSLRACSHKHPRQTDTSAINAWLEPLPAIVRRVCRARADFNAIQLTEERLANDPENYDKLFQYLSLVHSTPTLQVQTITEANKETFRSILQWLGGYLVKTVDDGIWYDEIIRRIQASNVLSLATIGGVRFPGDAKRIKAAGGIILEIRRPDIATKDVQDLTERERSLIRSDSIIINNHSLTQLERCASQVMKDLARNSLAGSYTASSF